jgi:FAD/FMN-containing dehydrogenase/Fe-S oxidoreductase
MRPGIRQNLPGTNVLSDAQADALRRPVLDSRLLENRLREATLGEVRFDNGSLAVYSADASNYRQVPIGIVVPRSLNDVVEAVRVCSALGAPVLMRGAGTSQNGQGVNVAVVIDTSKYLNRVLQIDTEARTALVEPGVVCDYLRNAAERYALTFGPDPATHSRCTLGGMIGNNSCGAHSVMAGKTIENVEEIEILTYDGARFWAGPTSEAELESIVGQGGRRGEIYVQLKELSDRYADRIRAEFPNIKRRVSGYNLDQLLPENGFNVARALVGTEGSCALTLRAKLRLIESPQVRVLLVLGYPDIYQAGDASPDVMRFNPIALEGLDEPIIGGLLRRGLKREDIALMPEGNGWLIVEFGADTRAAAVDRARAAMDWLQGADSRPTMVLYDHPGEQARIWSIRELGASATAISEVAGEPNPIVGWEDAAVHPSRLGEYLREFQRLIDDHGYQTCLYGHFGDGCVHARINFNLRSEQGLVRMRQFLVSAAALVVKFGGSLSGEHGDGQAKAEFLPIMFSAELMQAMREFKAIWDPRNKLNPGKLIDAYRFDDNLRLGASHHTVGVQSLFSYRDKQGNFGHAVEHCIGMGRCRAHQGGTMCPSYRATGEEAHSTRGRSRLLFEMLKGELIPEGWRSEAVKSALDMCLACKGCRSECPTHVDMATYKADFLSRYYQYKRRPVHAYAMGWIHRWAPLGVSMAPIINGIARTPGLNTLIKRCIGMAPQRQIPLFAKRTFTSWFNNRGPVNVGRTKVILWPDTFNNHFHPEVAQAAVEVLEALGYAVTLPARRLCCGRALYDFGMLDLAKRLLQDILDSAYADIKAGVAIVGLEPACVAVFRDELLNLFPDDPIAQALSKQVFLFSEFLAQRDFVLPALQCKAVVHGHCHQKSVMGMQSETALLERLGLAYVMPESGCCGMSGAFGFDRDKYQVSMKIGERELLPAVRQADADTLIIANGYSCREQIAQGTGRTSMHIAEVVKLAMAPSMATRTDRGHHAAESV